MRIWLFLAIALVACGHRRDSRPNRPPGVYVRQLPPVIGERFTYHIVQQLKLVLTDGTETLAATETTDAEAEEVVTAVANGVATERTIRFLKSAHQPLGSPPLPDLVTGKTYRWTGTPPPEISDAERTSLLAYARGDTGAPDLAAYALTDRDFVRGVAVDIPVDQPGPFAKGMHDGTSITLIALDGAIAQFAIRQVRVLQVRDSRINMTLEGTIVMNVGTARVERILVEGHITQPTGPVREAHMKSQQTFTYAR